MGGTYLEGGGAWPEGICLKVVEIQVLLGLLRELFLLVFPGIEIGHFERWASGVAKASMERLRGSLRGGENSRMESGSSGVG